VILRDLPETQLVCDLERFARNSSVILRDLPENRLRKYFCRVTFTTEWFNVTDFVTLEVFIRNVFGRFYKLVRNLFGTFSRDFPESELVSYALHEKPDRFTIIL
jgi:hypothetical protein